MIHFNEDIEVKSLKMLQARPCLTRKATPLQSEFDVILPYKNHCTS